jgi:hypothetical protein
MTALSCKKCCKVGWGLPKRFALLEYSSRVMERLKARGTWMFKLER